MSVSPAAPLQLSPLTSHDDPALPAIRTDVAARLARVCAHVPPEELARLVDRIARFKRRWQLREAPADLAADDRLWA